MLHLIITDAAAAPDWTWLTQAGSAGLLAAAVIGFIRGWIVSGSQYREVIAQRDKALEQVFKLAETAQRAIEVAERKTSR